MKHKALIIPFPRNRLTRKQREQLHALAQSWNMPPHQVLDALLLDACLLRNLHPDFPDDTFSMLSDSGEDPS
jgi:hypothetical protein